MKNLQKLTTKAVKNLNTVKGGTNGEKYDSTLNSIKEFEIVEG